MLRRLMMAVQSGPASVFLDDITPAPRAALSLSKLISDAATCVRVRRSADNAEQDIGFSGDSLDIAALMSFAGSGSAFVTTVYDQTGNGENLIQATAASQPRIVNAGAYDGKLVFDGSDDSMRIQSLSLGSPQVGLYFRFALPGSYASNNMLYELTPEFVFNGPGTIASYREPSGWTVQSQSGAVPAGVRSLRYNPSPWATLGQRTFLYDTARTGQDQIRVWNSGVFVTGESTSSAGNQSGSYKSGADLFVGSRNGTTLYCSLWLHTLVVYNADSNAIRAQAESVIGA